MLVLERLERLAERAHEFGRDRAGVVAIQMALTLTALLGMAGLATDVGLVYFKQRQMQTAADAAAFSGAVLVQANNCSNSTYQTAAQNEALAVATQNGFTTSQSNGVTVTALCPPPAASAVDAGNNNAVQVVIQQTQSPLLSSLVYSGSFAVKAQSVALVTSTQTTTTVAPAACTAGSSCACILQTQPSVSSGIQLTGGGANLSLTACGIIACSTHTSLSISGGGTSITAQSVTVGGTVSLTGGGGNSLNGKGPTCSSSSSCTPNTACASNVDPYKSTAAGLTLPPSGCSLGSGTSYNGNQTISPPSNGTAAVWCSGVTFNYGTHTLNAGVYYVNGGTFSVQGGGTVIATAGVTIVLTGSGSNFASVNVANGTNLDITAPATGPTAGIAMLGDPNGPIGAQNSFQGGSSSSITGALYFPSESIVIGNNFSLSTTNYPSNCTQLIGGAITFQGGEKVSNSGCAGTGTLNPGSGSTTIITTYAPSLVE